MSRSGFWWVVSAAILVRLFVFVHARSLEYGSSAAFKLGDTARNILEGRGIMWDPLYLKMLNEESRSRDAINPPFELFEEVIPPSPSPERLEPFRGRPPGYSFILAATWKIFGKKLFVYSQAFFVFLDLCACIGIWWLAGRIFGERAGFVSGMCYALMFPNAVMSIFPGHDAIGTFPLVFGAFFYWLYIENSQIRYLFAAGIVIAFGTLIRQEPYLLPVVFAGALVLTRQWKKAMVVFVVMQSMVVLANIPWTTYNKKMFGKSIPLSPSVAGNLLAGIGDSPNPWGVKASDAWLRDFVASKVGLQPYHSIEFNRVCKDEFLRIVKEDPVWYVMSVVRRGIKSLTPTIMPFRNSYSYFKETGNAGGLLSFASTYPIQAVVPFIFKLLWVFLWGSTLWFLLFSWRGWDLNRRAFALAMFGTPLYYFTSHVLMHCEARFLLPGYFALVLLGGAGAAVLATNLLPSLASADSKAGR